MKPTLKKIVLLFLAFFLIHEIVIIADGLMREKWVNGITVIGYSHWRRSERDEGRVYRLKRFNGNEGSIGEVHYEELILKKDAKYIRYVAEYRFEPETLDWLNISHPDNR